MNGRRGFQNPYLVIAREGEVKAEMLFHQGRGSWRVLTII
jgi:hypothetical protein